MGKGSVLMSAVQKNCKIKVKLVLGALACMVSWLTVPARLAEALQSKAKVTSPTHRGRSLSTSKPSTGAEAKVTESQGEFIAITRLLPAFPIPLYSSGGVPRVLKWKRFENQPTGILVLLYDSGDAGTSAIYQINRAAVINWNTKTVVGDEIYSYIAKGGAPRFTQPVWRFEGDTVRISEHKGAKDLVIDLK